MTITVNLSPEAEANLLVQAKGRGLSLDLFLQTVIAQQAASGESVKPFEALPPDADELDRVIDELFDTVQLPPGVGQGAMRRENWYR